MPEPQTAAQVETWLLEDAVRVGTLLELYEMFVWRLVVAGLPLDRASLHVGTSAPATHRLCLELEYRRRTDGRGQGRRGDTCDRCLPAHLRSRSCSRPARRSSSTRWTGLQTRFGLTADLIELGITQYIAFPLGGAGYHNVATIATRQPGGFTTQQRDALERLLRLLALHVERHIAMRIASNVLDTYLGKLAGARVLEGSIKRGAGTRISAVIWASDLRGFTDLSDRLAPADMLALLNAYFEAVTGSVIAHGGEVLKFIGDGLLAVFPHDAEYGAENAAEAAVAAALAAEQAVARLNNSPPEALAAIDGWRPLRSGIALHEGDVFFGNIGAPERLDFTVIGRAVNGASRVESMTKQLGHTIVLTAPVADRLKARPKSLGRHALRGMAEPIEIFGL